MSDVIETSGVSESAEAPLNNENIEVSEDSTTLTTTGDSSSEGLTIEDAVKEALGDDGSEEVIESSEEIVEEKIEELKKKLKLKVDGEEIEEEIDWNDEDRLKRALQKEKAFDKRSQEFSKFQKQVDQFFGNLKENPFSVLEEMGMDVKEIVTEYARNAVEESKKSPEQLEQEKMQRELQELRDEKERMAKEKEESDLERMRNQHATQIQNDIRDALDDTQSILPKNNPAVIADISKALYLAMNNGYPNATVKDVIPLVEKQYEKNFKALFDVFPEDMIEKVVGKNNLDRVRKKRVKKRKANTQTARQVAKPTNNSSSPVESESKSQKTYKDMFDPRFD